MVNVVLYALNPTRSLMFFASCHAGTYMRLETGCGLFVLTLDLESQLKKDRSFR